MPDESKHLGGDADQAVYVMSKNLAYGMIRILHHTVHNPFHIHSAQGSDE